MIDQLPVWMWWVIAICLVAFTGALLKIIAWFLGKFIDDNKASWETIKKEVKNLTSGISELVITTTKHEERISHHNSRLNHHDEEINEFRKKI